jgi:hypothetical protein
MREYTTFFDDCTRRECCKFMCSALASAMCWTYTYALSSKNRKAKPVQLSIFAPFTENIKKSESLNLYGGHGWKMPITWKCIGGGRWFNSAYFTSQGTSCVGLNLPHESGQEKGHPLFGRYKNCEKKEKKKKKQSLLVRGLYTSVEGLEPSSYERGGDKVPC